MGKLAFVFSGQGAQYGGMGKELYENVPVCAEMFGRLDAIRPGTSALCFSGTDDELSETINTQPAMFAVELAAAAAMTAAGIAPDSVAGFSLGELAALTYAGSLSPEDGFRLVCRRAELMQEASGRVDSSMAAVVRLDADTVNKLCRPYENVFPVNYNSPQQITVAGLKAELDQFSLDVREAGGRALPVKVKGAFHTKFMASAAEGFACELLNVDLQQPRYTLYSNYTGKPYEGDMKELLANQICNPVRWHDIVCNMIADGVDTFVELGPGKTLCTLIAKTDANVRVFNVEDMKSFNATIGGLKEC